MLTREQYKKKRERLRKRFDKGELSLMEYFLMLSYYDSERK